MEGLELSARSLDIFQNFAAKMLALVALLVAMVIGSSESFLLTRVDPGKVTVQPGEGVNLLCVVSNTFACY